MASRVGSRGSTDETIAMLHAMFTDLSQSSLRSIVTHNQNDVEKCVETILELLNDPMKVVIEEEQRALAREAEKRAKHLEELQKAQASSTTTTATTSSPAASSKSGSVASYAAVVKGTSAANSSRSTSSVPSVSADTAKSNSAAAPSNSQASQNSVSSSPAPLTQPTTSTADEAARRLAWEKELYKDFQERQKEQEKVLAAKIAEIEEDKRRKLEDQVRLIREQYDEVFTRKLQAEIAKRLMELEQQQQSAKNDLPNSRNQQLADAAVEPTDSATCQVELEVDVHSCEPGAKVIVKWSYKKGTPTAYDWIGYFKSRRAVERKDYYLQQSTNGAASGSMEFVIPNKYGFCEFRFFRNDSYSRLALNNAYTLLARSASFRVGPAVDLIARLDNGVLSVRRKQLEGKQSSWDWIGLYSSAEQDNHKYIGMAYCAEEPTTTVTFKAPRAPGVYVARFFSGSSGYSELKESNPVTVDDRDALVAEPTVQGRDNPILCTVDISSVEHHPKNWVGLYAVGETVNSNYKSYEYVKDGTKPLKFTVSQVGHYEFRFFPVGSTSFVKSSNSFEVV